MDLLGRSERRIPILTYHQIARAPVRGTPFRSLCVAPDDFRRQMEFLKRWGYLGLSMTNLMPYLRGEKRGKVVGITFDDGYLNNLENAAPVLHGLGFSSTCYAVSGLLGSTNRWDEPLGVPQVPLMDEAELRRWCAAGQEVGAHTCSHVRLPAVEDAQALAEIERARSGLEAAIGQPVLHFCYPYGEFEKRHVDMVRGCGYLTATTTLRGRFRPGDDVFTICRIPVVRSSTRAHLWAKIATAYEDGKAA